MATSAKQPARGASAKGPALKGASAQAPAVKVAAGKPPPALRNWVFIPLGALAIVVPAFLIARYLDREPPPHQPLCPIPPPQVMDDLPAPVVRPTPPTPPRLTPVEERDAAVARFRRDEEFANQFFSPREKPVPGPGTYAVVFNVVVDPRMLQSLEERGLRFGEIYGPRSYEVFVSSLETYEVLSSGDVECIAPWALDKTPPKPQPRNSWRIQDEPSKEKNE